MNLAEQPVVSVIIPVRNDAENLRRSVASLIESSYPNVEILVVDDASTDDTPEAANAMPVRVLRLPEQTGPAGARNRGAQQAAGEILFFVDADVCVDRDTVEKVVQTFRDDPGVDAVFGAYDRKPAAENFVSQYKNLFHHFVHQDAGREASTFWSGCGAIKRSVFLDMGGFDDSYGRPCIEDIELGVRMRAAGLRIVLNKEIQVTHLKRWTLRGVVKTDFWDRGVPWTELMLRSGAIPNDLNLKFSQRICALLVVGVFIAMLVGIWHWPVLLLIVLSGLISLEIIDGWTRVRTVPVSIRAAALGLTLAAGYAVVVRFQTAALVVFALHATVVLINHKLYRFFAREKSFLFAVAVVPLHAIYYLYSVAAFACGTFSYLVKSKRSLKAPEPATGDPSAPAS